MRMTLSGLASLIAVGMLVADTSTGGLLKLSTYLSAANNLQMVGSDGSVIQTPSWYLALVTPVGGVMTQVQGRRIGGSGVLEPVVASFSGTTGFVNAGGDWELDGFAQGQSYGFSVATFHDPNGLGFAASLVRTICPAGQVILGGNDLNPPQPAVTFAFGGAQVCVVTVPRPPTAAGLAYFRAVRQGGGPVAVSWQTLVEAQVLGFRVERALAGGPWEAAGNGVVPAAGQSRPQQYLVGLDRAGGAGTRYRLIELDFLGQERVAAEAAELAALDLRVTRSPSALAVELRGEPGTTAVVEAAGRVEGPWAPVNRVRLDDSGGGTFTFELDRSQPARFLRVLAE